MGRSRCAAAATRHGVYALAEAGCLPNCSTCPSTVRDHCPEAATSEKRAKDAPCVILGSYRAALLDSLASQLEEVEGHLLPHEWPLVCDYAKTLTVLARIDQVLAAQGTEVSVVVEEAVKPEKPGQAWAQKRAAMDLAPLLRERATWSSLALRQAEALGLSPAGRVKLGLRLEAGGGPRKPATLEAIAGELEGEAKP